MLINRDDVINVLLTAFTNHERNEEYMLPVAKVKQEIADIVSELPTVESRPKGEWIGIGYDGYADGNPVYDEWECSNCGNEIKTEDTPPYCEICGADMREERADGTD